MSKIKIKNAFGSLDTTNRTILYGELIEGGIVKGHKLVIGNCVLEIDSFEILNQKEVNLFVNQNSISKCDNLKIYQLYGNTYNMIL